MNIQRKNSAHHFRMQSEREQTLIYKLWGRSDAQPFCSSHIKSRGHAVEVVCTS